MRPWLGLETYTESDAHLFYGRSVEIKELTQVIAEFPQTIIYGPSGTGKSSILRAGIFPRLKEMNFLPVPVRFDHSENAASYNDQILALLKLELEHSNIDIVPLAARNPGSPAESVWEFLHRNEFWSRQNQLLRPVIVIDQFEEIFTVTRHQERVKSFITDLGDLCNNTIPEEVNRRLVQTGERLNYPVGKQNYRLVISLREDFLARLEEVAADIPVLKRNRHSLKALSSEQAMEVVLGPGRDLVNEEVARVIILKAAAGDKDGQADQQKLQIEPALLSLLCSELNNQRIKEAQDHISLGLVETSSTDIIRHFYEDSMRSVSPATAAYIEDNLLTASGYRNSVAMDDVMAHGIPEQEIQTLINKRLLRFEEIAGIKRVEFTHDILTAVAKVKRDNRRYELKLQYDKKELEKLQAEKALQKKKLKSYIWISTILFILLVSVCVVGYILFFRLYEYKYAHVIKRWGFYEGVDKVSDDEASHMHMYYKLSKKGLYTFSLQKKHFDKMSSMNGYGNLTTDNDMYTYLYANDDDDSGVDDDIKERLGSVCQWSIVSNEDGKPVYEMGFDKDNIMVWGFVYSPIYHVDTTPAVSTNSKKVLEIPDKKNNSYIENSVVVGHYVDNTGIIPRIGKDSAEYVRISYDKNGYDSLIRYFDLFGFPALGPDGAFATRYENNEKGFPISMASLDEFGDPVIDSTGNCGVDLFYDKKNNQVGEVSFGIHHEKKSLNSGYTIVKDSFDRYNNLIEARYFDSAGKPAISGSGRSGYRKYYDDRGNDTLFLNLDTAGNITSYSDSGNYNGLAPVTTYKYDAYGNLTDLARYEEKNNQRIPLKMPGRDYFRFTCHYNKYHKITSVFYYDKDLKLINSDNYSGFTKWYDSDGNDTLMIYYNKDSVPDNNHKITRKWYSNGYLSRQELFNNQNKPAVDSAGVHGFIIKRDSIKFTDTLIYIDTLGKPAKDLNYTFEVKKYTNSRFNEISSASYLDIDNGNN